VAPPRAVVRRRRPVERELAVQARPAVPVLVTTRDLRLAAAAGAALLAATGRGDALLLGGLLAVAAAPRTRVIPLFALAGVALRWGTTSLTAIGGAQTVLGSAASVGPAPAAAACWCAAGALVLAAPRSLAGVAAGVTAAFVVAGPARVPVRLGATLVALLAAALAMWLPARIRMRVGFALASAAVVCGAVA
jgi:hypothetical protein